MSFLVRVCTCILLAIPLACGELPLEPTAITGTWALETVEGQPVPATVLDQPFATLMFISDTLDLAADGVFQGRRCEMRIDHVLGAQTTVCIPYSGSWSLRVRALELWYDCPLSTGCYGSTASTGTIRAGRLVLSAAPDGPALAYVRAE